VLAPERGVTGLAVGHDQVHDVPGRWDCRSCHGGRAEGVLGFSALQLSRDRDPLAPHAEPPRPGDVDLEELIERGRIVNFPPSLQRPRIVAATDRERAVLGYFHGNCGGCHQADGALSALTLRLDHSIADDRPNTTFLTAGVVVPGDPAASALLRRMSSRDQAMQMPPLGTRVADTQALALIDAWIREDLAVRVASDSPNHEEKSR
jgi:mono/diheme cytochrome c family protein